MFNINIIYEIYKVLQILQYYTKFYKISHLHRNIICETEISLNKNYFIIIISKKKYGLMWH